MLLVLHQGLPTTKSSCVCSTRSSLICCNKYRLLSSPSFLFSSANTQPPSPLCPPQLKQPMSAEEGSTTGSLLRKKNHPTIRISRKHIFCAVAEQLGLVIKQELPLQIRNSDYAAKIVIGGFKITEAQNMDTGEFLGTFSATADEALGDAYDKALKFLVEKEMVTIDDFSHPELHTALSKLALSNTYLMFAEEGEGYLEDELNFKVQGYKKLASTLIAACEQSSQILPISVHRCTSCWDNTEKALISYTGQTSATDTASNLARSLAQMHTDIKVHGQELPPASVESMKTYRERSRAISEI